MADRLQPVQQKILNLLSDGLWHSKEEVHGCLVDDMGPIDNISPHLYALRKYLHSKRLYIICAPEYVSIGKVDKGYRLVRFLSSADDCTTHITDEPLHSQLPQ